MAGFVGGMTSDKRWFIRCSECQMKALEERNIKKQEKANFKRVPNWFDQHVEAVLEDYDPETSDDLAQGFLKWREKRNAETQ